MIKKIILFFMSIMVLTISQGLAANIACAQTTNNFNVSATIPSSNSISINAFRVDLATNQYTRMEGTTLSFDPMTFNAQQNIYAPSHRFAIEVSGASSPNVTVSFAEGVNPNNNPNKGLGHKSTATFFKVAGTTEIALTAHGPKKLLSNLNSERITKEELAGGVLRMYLGIVTLGAGQTFPDPVGAEAFTNADIPGKYDGTVTVSATLT